MWPVEGILHQHTLVKQTTASYTDKSTTQTKPYKHTTKSWWPTLDLHYIRLQLNKDCVPETQHCISYRHMEEQYAGVFKSIQYTTLLGSCHLFQKIMLMLK